MLNLWTYGNLCLTWISKWGFYANVYNVNLNFVIPYKKERFLCDLYKSAHLTKLLMQCTVLHAAVPFEKTLQRLFVWTAIHLFEWTSAPLRQEMTFQLAGLEVRTLQLCSIFISFFSAAQALRIWLDRKIL